MGISNDNKIAIASKRLAGKAHTSQGLEDYGETIGSNIQIDNTTIFVDAIPSTLPDNPIFGQVAGGCVQYVEFSVEPIAGTDSVTLGRKQGYVLKLPANYSTNYTNNPKAGTAPFLNGATLGDSFGKLQIVPPKYAPFVNGINPYVPKLEDGSGNTIPLLSDIDWNLDTYAGTLFVQDNGALPVKMKAWLYIGNYLSDVVAGNDGTGETTFDVTNINSEYVSSSVVEVTSITASNAQIDDLNVNRITAKEFRTNTVTTQSGSTKFGNSIDDSHQFTGNINITGSITILSGVDTSISGTVAEFTVITASVISASSIIGIPTDIARLNNQNTFTANNTFTTISGTVAEFTVITASVISASSIIGIPTDIARLDNQNTFTANNTFTTISASAINLTNYDSIFKPTSADARTVWRNNPGADPYWSFITEDMIVKLMTFNNFSITSNINLEVGESATNNFLLQTSYEVPNVATITNSRDTATITNINFGPLTNSISTATATTLFSYGATASDGDALTFTATVNSQLRASASYPALQLNATRYWGRYIYWGTSTTKDPIYNETFVRGLKNSTNGSYYLRTKNSLIGHTFNNVPTPSWAFVAWPAIWNVNVTGLSINGFSYLLANQETQIVATNVGVRTEQTNNNQIGYKIMRVEANFTANTSNTQVMSFI